MKHRIVIMDDPAGDPPTPEQQAALMRWFKEIRPTDEQRERTWEKLKDELRRTDVARIGSMEKLQHFIDEAIAEAKAIQEATPAENPTKKRVLALIITKLEEGELWLTKLW